MDDHPLDPVLFPLTIQIDADGLQWTHFYGNVGVTTTLLELPLKLGSEITPLLEHAYAEGISEIKLIAENDPVLRLDHSEAQEDLLAEHIFALKRVAWWLEWCRRKTIGFRRNNWACPQCEESVPAKTQRCKDKTCLSHLLLTNITGERSLRLVGRTGTDNSS